MSDYQFTDVDHRVLDLMQDLRLEMRAQVLLDGGASVYRCHDLRLEITIDEEAETR